MGAFQRREVGQKLAQVVLEYLARMEVAVNKDKRAASHWPAFRYSNDQGWTMADRIRGCYTVLGMPAPDFYSEPIIALTLFMNVQANGVRMDLPGFIR